MRHHLIFIVSSVGLLTACADRYEEGYARGFSDGISLSSVQAEEQCKEKLEEQSASRESRRATTEDQAEVTVCGGGGVNVRNQHYPGGKTGCVTVFRDGRVRQY